MIYKARGADFLAKSSFLSDISLMNFSDIGKLVSKERRNHHYTQDQLADIAGVSRSTISAIENGSFDELGVRKIARVCGVLHLEISVGPVTINEDYAAEEFQAANEADRRIEQARSVRV